MTLIAWTDVTANFWMGCRKVSPGCSNCYAEELTRNRMGLKLWGAGSNRQAVKAAENKLRQQARLAESCAPGVMGPGNPHLVFVGSLMDWAEDHPDAEALRPKIWEAVRKYPGLHFQLLTKRPENIEYVLPDDWGDGYQNVWLGTSIENNDYAHRADDLRRIPAIVRFVSYEPAIGPLDALDLAGISWVIYGGESGNNRRPEDKQWARDMRDRCARSNVAFFHKQSAHRFTERGIELDGQIIRQFPLLGQRKTRPTRHADRPQSFF